MVILLSPTPYDGTLHLPIIKQIYLRPTIDLSSFDAIIFTSKQAVKALDLITHDWKKLKIFSIGSGTSQMIRSTGGEVFYEASEFYGDDLALEITKKYPDLIFFYPRAKEVSSNLEKILINSNITITSAILYETVCNQIDLTAISDNTTIIFTSPSTVKCFFEQSGWKDSWKAVAIGKRTHDALARYTTSHIAPKPTIKSAVEFALSLKSV